MAYILKKRIKGRTYYYLAESQRVNGSPRIVWQKYLGTADRIKEKLLESQKEYIEDISTFEIGSLAAIESIEREINFIKIVDEIVPKRDQGMSVGLYLYLIVLNRAIEPKSKASLGAWLKKTAISEYREIDFSLLDSANFWDHMDKVSQEQIEAISDEVAKRVIDRYGISLDCLLYDTTNYFTQMSGQTESELSRYAHSKAGKHQLRHVGLALLCNREEGVPLFHRLYSANTHDSKLFSQIQQELFQLLLSLRRGKERMTLVQKTPLIGLADQLKKKLKKDILDYSFEYRNLLRQILDGTGGDPADALRRMRDHIYLDPIKVKNFASYLNDLEGQKHVILLFQNELMPVPKSVNYLTIISLVQESNLNIEEIRNYFAESSIHFHFSFITRRENHFLDIERQLSFESMQMQFVEFKQDLFSVFKDIADTTGGITDSSYNARISFQKAVEAVENYYLLYYTPNNYRADGKYHTIKLKIKEGGYRIVHRQGYIAD